MNCSPRHYRAPFPPQIIPVASGFFFTGMCKKTLTVLSILPLMYNNNNNNRNTEWLKLEGASSGHLVQHKDIKQGHLELLAQDHLQAAFEALSKAGDSTTSLDNSYSVSHIVKCFLMFKQNHLFSDLWPLLLVLVLVSSWVVPSRYQCIHFKEEKYFCFVSTYSDVTVYSATYLNKLLIYPCFFVVLFWFLVVLWGPRSWIQLSLWVPTNSDQIFYGSMIFFPQIHARHKFHHPSNAHMTLCVIN